MKIHEKLHQVRKEKGYSMMEASAKIGASYPALRRWELGITDASAEAVAKLAKLYGVSGDELLCLDKLPMTVLNLRDGSHILQVLKLNSVSLFKKD